MRRLIVAGCALLALALPELAVAEGSPLGAWHVTGNVSGHDFALDCRFEPASAGFGGTCTETAVAGGAGHPGKVHKLTRGTVAGNTLTWAYPVSAMFMTFDMTFEGAVSGDHITGTTNAAGRKGTFTARR